MIQEIYHKHNGVDGYRSMKVYWERKGINLSNLTVHKYMNKELKLNSIVRRKKPDYRKGKPHKIFDNLIKQEFRADSRNEKWCTDFTYLFLTDGSKRYNCTILDLYDRSVIASITDKNITANLAIRTLKKALESQPKIKEKLILHSIMVTDFWPAMALMLTFHITRQMKEPSSMKAKKVTMQFISMHCMISPIRPTAISLCRGKRNFMNALHLTQ